MLLIIVAYLLIIISLTFKLQTYFNLELVPAHLNLLKKYSSRGLAVLTKLSLT